MKSTTNVIVLSSPASVEEEHAKVIQLFEAGLERFHLRKPDFSDVDYAQWLAQIPNFYWNRIVLHHHYHLAEQLGLGGIHLTEQARKNWTSAILEEQIRNFKAEGLLVSAAVHQRSDFEVLGHLCDYVLVSPVFDSISKPNHYANENLNVHLWKKDNTCPLIALGGVIPKNIPLAIKKGFDGVAVLGYLWQKPSHLLAQFKQLQDAFDKPSKALPRQHRPYVLTIAGHDPSAGAGLSADLKTMEQHQVYGLSVCTALTIQNDKDFEAVEWVNPALILQQIQILQQRFDIAVVKVGLIENWKILKQIRETFEGTPIIFDPILKASAGFEFHSQFEALSLLKGVTLITPNSEEILKIVPEPSPELAAQVLSYHCAVLLKGGHRAENRGKDELWQHGQCIAQFPTEQQSNWEKHGSGCVLSAAIASELAKGSTLILACQKAKRYVEQFLTSNVSLLGYHHSI
jgi:thiamine-phosphate pyrophosphorylase